ncbi:MAG: ATP-dependent metallopeptidase FtsH/Yme1/Tma family protein, partial [Planctomycetota bacterium]|nr:ATP-dependent metallopeptidase FtsH/Yme1/Tma family protein [Planctomycetota bacterium]
MDTQPTASNSPKQTKPRVPATTLWLIIVMVVVLVFAYFQSDPKTRSTIRYDMFRRELKANNVTAVKWINDSEIQGEFKNAPLAPLP